MTSGFIAGPPPGPEITPQVAEKQPARQQVHFFQTLKYGSFTQTNGNQWTNLDPSGVQYTFVEQGRGNGFVELRDFNRNLSVRLLTDGRTMLNMGQGWGFGTAGSGRFISY